MLDPLEVNVLLRYDVSRSSIKIENKIILTFFCKKLLLLPILPPLHTLLRSSAEKFELSICFLLFFSKRFLLLKILTSSFKLMFSWMNSGAFARLPEYRHQRVWTDAAVPSGYEGECLTIFLSNKILTVLRLCFDATKF